MFGLGVVVVVVVVVRGVVTIVGGACVGGNAVPDMDDEIDGRGLGTVRLEHASIITGQPRKLTINSNSIVAILYLSNTTLVVIIVDAIVAVVLVECICSL